MCGPKFRPPPYKKTREDANLLPISKPFVSWRALFKTNQCFLQCKLGCISTFWQPIDKPKDKFIGNYAFCKKRDLYLNQFSSKKGAIAKPESPKKHPIWAAHPRTHLSTKYPPPPGAKLQCKQTVVTGQKLLHTVSFVKKKKPTSLVKIDKRNMDCKNLRNQMLWQQNWSHFILFLPFSHAQKSFQILQSRI